MTTIYLALCPNGRNRKLFMDGGPRAVAVEDAPSVLVSYVYAKTFIADRPRYRIRSWCMDSSAFSVRSSGEPVDLDAYIECCQEQIATDTALDFVIALDVIGDWRAGLRNLEKMWAAGVPALPVFHIGEPEDLLLGLARDYPKICVGGVADLHGPARRKFAEQCFARVWPKRVHGLGIGNEPDVMTVPWSSVDASSWEMGPAAFGKWRAFGNRHLRIRGSEQDLRSEVRWYTDLEKRARWRWRREMSLLAEIPYVSGLRQATGVAWALGTPVHLGGKSRSASRFEPARAPKPST